MNELTLREAKSELERLQNQLEYWLEKKEINFNNTQPKSKPLTGESVSGGKRTDKNMQYVIKDEEIDNKIDLIVDQMKLYETFIEKELKRLQKYGKLKEQVIYFKETPQWNEKEKRYTDLTWDQIADIVHYSKTTCRNIYRNYKRKRDI